MRATLPHCDDWWLVARNCEHSAKPIMEASLKASNEVNSETAATNADFKRVLELMQAFRNDEYFWWQVAEYSYDTFMIPLTGADLAV